MDIQHSRPALEKNFETKSIRSSIASSEGIAIKMSVL